MDGKTPTKSVIFFLAARPKFLVASAAPVLVGSAAGLAMAGSFNTEPFILALLAILFLHAGANMTNDYFDHLSKNDWINDNPTPFSGGSRFIQKGILSPNATLLIALAALTIGSAIGLVIVLITKSLFILASGLVGLLGGFFYTAQPVRLGYRGIGEVIVALLFGLLPVCASYYLQTGFVDAVVFLPAIIVSLLIFLVILVNEFPDVCADSAVNKKTLIVNFGIEPCVWICRIALIASYLVAIAAAVLYRQIVYAGLLYLLTLPIAAVALRLANKNDLAASGSYLANKATIGLHAIGSLALAAGFIIFSLLA